MSTLLYDLGGHGLDTAELASTAGCELGGLELDRFPDRETYVRVFDQVEDRDVALLCSLRHPDRRLWSLLLVADTLRDLGARRVALVAPYLAYLRQDARFRPGEGVTSHYAARILSAHFDHLITVDPHLHRISSLSEVYSISTEVVHSAPVLSAWIRQEVEQPLLIGPDAESRQWVSEIATLLDAPHLVLEKLRRSAIEVEVSAPDISAYPGHTPVLVDDIISTGRTLAKTMAQIARPEVYCVAVHALFDEEAHAFLDACGARDVVTANTVRHASNRVRVDEPVAAALACWIRS